MSATQNDKAWEHLFKEYRILEHINREGMYTITSTQINTVRESRLMAKFDHRDNLPNIFRQHGLSILPVSRSQYVIGYFDTHHSIAPDNEIEAIPIQPPGGLESLDPANVYSEAAALSFAFNTGMINALLGEQFWHTVSGRMSTETFSFSVQSTRDGIAPYTINVDNSQCEIDGGFESDQYFVLVEAKNYAVDDFLIRQLYYPYRLWSNKLRKKVIPVLMTFSNDIFDFFVYEFENLAMYNSLKLIKHKRYALEPEAIQRSDIDALFASVQRVEEPDDVPFLQANTFDRVVDLLTILASRDLTKDDITAGYAFAGRQTQYYVNAARYLGLVEWYKSPATQEEMVRLTDEARSLLKLRHKAKYLRFIRKMLEHEVLYKTFELALQQGAIPDNEAISQIIVNSNIKSYTKKHGASMTISGKTVPRRASTVSRWVKWIWEQIED